MNLLQSQNCGITFNGHVIDSNSQLPLEFVNLYIPESKNGAVTNDKGVFQFKNLCEGEYHIVVSHIGCETKTIHIDLDSDTTIFFQLDHLSHTLGEAVVTSSRNAQFGQSLESISSKYIFKNIDENFSTLLSSIKGVSTLSNGSHIAKPVVNGMYGNRLMIVNNGVPLYAQQWGNDHAPEIDVSQSNRIEVIKGVGSVKYQGSSLGAVVSVMPHRIAKEPHLHGNINYFHQTNGRGHGISGQIKEYYKNFGWRLSLGGKISGDNKTPDYYLRNTGYREGSASLQVEQTSKNKGYFAQHYVSFFNTDLGVLRGSHIGNLTDLKLAFDREEPFFTNEDFSYRLEAPKQGVYHLLLKHYSRFELNKEKNIEVNVSGQINNRKEFDIRRGGRTKIPALYLKKYTQILDFKYTDHLTEQQEIQSGFQLTRIDNENDAETGILPLIPDYIEWKTGGYLHYDSHINQLFLELGGRMDILHRTSYTITRDFPREIKIYENAEIDFVAMIAGSYTGLDNTLVKIGAGLTRRNHAINELFSFGLHQGVGGIEEGNPDLNAEDSYKITLEFNKSWLDKFSFESQFFIQKIDDYIFLNPTGEYRLTIRGAFPIFRYEQTNARILGFDIDGNWHVNDAIGLNVQYSLLRGDDVVQNLPIINLPSNVVKFRFHYDWSKVLCFENIEFKVSSKYVFKQNRILLTRDFVPPPDGYFILNSRLDFEKQLSKYRLLFYLKGSNLFNTNYRDYLNKSKYFANDLGISIVLGCRMFF